MSNSGERGPEMAVRQRFGCNPLLGLVGIMVPKVLVGGRSAIPGGLNRKEGLNRHGNPVRGVWVLEPLVMDGGVAWTK